MINNHYHSHQQPHHHTNNNSDNSGSNNYPQRQQQQMDYHSSSSTALHRQQYSFANPRVDKHQSYSSSQNMPKTASDISSVTQLYYTDNDNTTNKKETVPTSMGPPSGYQQQKNVYDCSATQRSFSHYDESAPEYSRSPVLTGGQTKESSNSALVNRTAFLNRLPSQPSDTNLKVTFVNQSQNIGPLAPEVTRSLSPVSSTSVNLPQPHHLPPHQQPPAQQPYQHHHQGEEQQHLTDRVNFDLSYNNHKNNNNSAPNHHHHSTYHQQQQQQQPLAVPPPQTGNKQQQFPTKMDNIELPSQQLEESPSTSYSLPRPQVLPSSASTQMSMKRQRDYSEVDGDDRANSSGVLYSQRHHQHHYGSSVHVSQSTSHNYPSYHQQPLPQQQYHQHHHQGESTSTQYHHAHYVEHGNKRMKVDHHSGDSLSPAVYQVDPSQERAMVDMYGPPPPYHYVIQHLQYFEPYYGPVSASHPHHHHPYPLATSHPSYSTSTGQTYVHRSSGHQVHYQRDPSPYHQHHHPNASYHPLPQQAPANNSIRAPYSEFKPISSSGSHPSPASHLHPSYYPSPPAASASPSVQHMPRETMVSPSQSRQTLLDKMQQEEELIKRIKSGEPAPLTKPIVPPVSDPLSIDSHLSHQPKKQFLPPSAVETLKDWFYTHINYPYPTTDERAYLSEVTGLSNLQITNWFTNERKRKWTPKMKKQQQQMREAGIVATPWNPRSAKKRLKEQEQQELSTTPQNLSHL